MTQATVLTGPERRRRWSAAEKVRMVEESLAPGSRVTEVARRHDVHPNLLHLWRRQARTGVLSVGDDSRARFVPVAVALGNGAAVVTGDCGRSRCWPEAPDAQRPVMGLCARRQAIRRTGSAGSGVLLLARSYRRASRAASRRLCRDSAGRSLCGGQSALHG